MDSKNKQVAVTTFEAADKLNIKRPRLREWISRGYVEPAIPSTGRGVKAYLDLTNLYQLKLFDVLISKGYSRDQAAHAVQSIRRGGIQNKWDHKMPLLLTLYELSDGYRGESLFSSTEFTVMAKTERHGELKEHQTFNIGEIIRDVNQAFLV